MDCVCILSRLFIEYGLRCVTHVTAQRDTCDCTAAAMAMFPESQVGRKALDVILLAGQLARSSCYWLAQLRAARLSPWAGF